MKLILKNKHDIDMKKKNATGCKNRQIVNALLLILDFLGLIIYTEKRIICGWHTFSEMNLYAYAWSSR